jgi:hypothetical protein
VYAVQLTCDPVGITGETAAQVTGGGLDANPDFIPDDYGTVFVEATSAAKAVQTAIVGSLELTVFGQATSYIFDTTTVGTSASQQKPFLLVLDTPAGATTDWTIWLEDQTNFPTQSDWDYNDHSWTVTVWDTTPETGTSTVSGVVWEELTDDHDRDTPGDEFMSGVTVRLFRNGVQYGKAETDANGAYTFTALPAGSYKVYVHALALAEPVLKDAWPDEATDSDIHPDGWSNVMVLGDDDDAVIDAGLTEAGPPAAFARKNFGVILSEKGTGAAAGELRVAKWETAFASGETGQPVLELLDKWGHDFIDHDVNRFNVLVKDLDRYRLEGQQEVTSFTVPLHTENVGDRAEYDDAATQIEVKKLPIQWEGWYMSDSQMLVSNEVDDLYSQVAVNIPTVPGKKSGGLGADESAPHATEKNHKRISGGTLDWAVGDRTHRIALGGKVKVEFTPLNGPVGENGPLAEKVEVPVPVKKIVKLHVNIMRDKLEAQGGTPATTQAAVMANVKKMREIYAQIGIDVQLSNAGNPPEPAISNPPAGADLHLPAANPSLAENNTQPDATPAVQKMWANPTAEEKALLGDATLRTNPANVVDIEVYYVKRMSGGSGGESFMTNFLLQADQGLADSVVIADVQKLPPTLQEGAHTYLVLAHEVGHVLESRANASRTVDLTHFPYRARPPKNGERVNLMVTATPSILNGSGYLLENDGTAIPDVNRKPQYVAFGSAIYDSRRLTQEQETTMTTGHGGDLLTLPQG